MLLQQVSGESPHLLLKMKMTMAMMMMKYCCCLLLHLHFGHWAVGAKRLALHSQKLLLFLNACVLLATPPVEPPWRALPQDSPGC